MSRTLTRNFAFLITLCCLVPTAALVAVMFFRAPLGPVVLAASVALALLARRLFAILSAPGDSGSG
jgi:hypothetical protein